MNREAGYCRASPQRPCHQPEGVLAVLVGEGAVLGVIGVDEEVAVGLMAEREPFEKRPMLPGEGSIPLTGSR